MKILYSVQLPSLFAQVQKPAVCVLYCQIPYFWLISYLLLREKCSSAVITHNAMAL